jgi:transcriptional regulator with XRE-family HTH domain
MKKKINKPNQDKGISFKASLEIKKIRKMNNITQKQLATKLNITPQQIACYELGLSQLSLERFVEICDTLNIDCIELLKLVKPQSTFAAEKEDNHKTSEETIMEMLKTILKK